jgi:hypothetical protein
MRFFTAEARKAQVAALIGFLGPILLYIQAEGEWSWRAFVGAVISGVVAGAGVYATTNASPGSLTQETS